MGAASKIEWTDSTWNPIRARVWEIQNDGSGKERIGWHCEHVSEGCRNCYAESINLRLGTGFEFKPSNLRGKPGYSGGGIENPEVFLDEKMLLAPLRWKKPRMIFVCSMTDLFADFVKDEWIDRMFAVMALCPQHTFQVLTKRAGRMRAYMANVEREAYWMNNVAGILEGPIALKMACPAILRRHEPWLPLPNVWLGVSAERQQEADERIPDLLQTPAAVRFVSLEPLLGAIDLRAVARERYIQGMDALRDSGQGKLDWVITGGESGPHARPMHPDWARSLRNQCEAAGVAYFLKQWGEWKPEVDRDFHDPDWRADYTVVNREETQHRYRILNLAGGCGFHGERVHLMKRVGKKAAGRILDGVTHDEVPHANT